jgi:hypothetical protein
VTKQKEVVPNIECFLIEKIYITPYILTRKGMFSHAKYKRRKDKKRMYSVYINSKYIQLGKTTDHIEITPQGLNLKSPNQKKNAPKKGKGIVYIFDSTIEPEVDIVGDDKTVTLI